MITEMPQFVVTDFDVAINGDIAIEYVSNFDDSEKLYQTLTTVKKIYSFIEENALNEFFDRDGIKQTYEPTTEEYFVRNKYTCLNSFVNHYGNRKNTQTIIA